MFTPKELQEKTFDKAVFGGYDMQMVDEFLEPLTEDYITLYKENSVLKSKMKILVEKLEEYREQEISMKKALVAAQKTSESIIADAQKKAAGILNDAESAVSGKESSLQLELSAEQQRVERAKSTAQDFIDAVEREVRQHLSQLEALKRMAGPLRPAGRAPSGGPCGPCGPRPGGGAGSGGPDRQRRPGDRGPRGAHRRPEDARPGRRGAVREPAIRKKRARHKMTGPRSQTSDTGEEEESSPARGPKESCRSVEGSGRAA